MTTETPSVAGWPGAPEPVGRPSGAVEAAKAAPQDMPKAAGKPKPSSKTTAPKVVPRDIEGLTIESLDPNDPMMKLLPISLNDTAEIPPGGQFIGVNGKQFLLEPGKVYNVPRYVLEVLRNAVKGEPQLNDQMQVEGYRSVPRIPYTVRDDLMEI